MAHEEVSTRELVVVPTNPLDEESKVKSKEEPTEGHE